MSVSPFVRLSRFYTHKRTLSGLTITFAKIYAYDCLYLFAGWFKAVTPVCSLVLFGGLVLSFYTSLFAQLRCNALIALLYIAFICSAIVS